MTVAEAREPLLAEEADKLLDQDAIVREAVAEVESNGIVFLDEIDKICARDGRGGARRVARGRAARPAAADRGHDGRHQARPGQDRPHPVHRLGRVPHRQALGPAARTAGPPADPRRAEVADRGRLQAHPHRARGEPDQAVQGADGDRGRRRSTSPTTRSPRSPASPPRSTARSRTSARAACRR